MRQVNIRVQSVSLNRLAASLNQKYDKLKGVDASALKQVAHEILELSLAQVPVDTATLSSISGITDVSVGSTVISIKVGYGLNGKDAYNAKSGSMASSYMMQVHEDLTVQHQNGRKAKFLEDPINEVRPKIKSILAAATKSAL